MMVLDFYGLASLAQFYGLAFLARFCGLAFLEWFGLWKHFLKQVIGKNRGVRHALQ